MVNNFPYGNLLQQCLDGEFRIVNSGLAKEQKTLRVLLNEIYPHVVSCDGNIYSFKKKELQYIASLISPEEEEELLLPIIIEIGNISSEAMILCQTKIELKIISKILGMKMVSKDNRINIYRPQLSLLRNKTKTTTQYMFLPLSFE